MQLESFSGGLRCVVRKRRRGTRCRQFQVSPVITNIRMMSFSTSCEHILRLIFCGFGLACCKCKADSFKTKCSLFDVLSVGARHCSYALPHSLCRLCVAHRPSGGVPQASRSHPAAPTSSSAAPLVRGRNVATRDTGPRWVHPEPGQRFRRPSAAQLVEAA